MIIVENKETTEVKREAKIMDTVLKDKYGRPVMWVSQTTTNRGQLRAYRKSMSLMYKEAQKKKVANERELRVAALRKRLRANAIHGLIA